MSYSDIGTWLFLLWWGGCWMAYFLSFNTGRDTRMVPMLFGITIATFYVLFHGKAAHWHFWWYAWNSVPNLLLFTVAAYAPQAKARLPLLVISAAGFSVDATYFVAAASGNRLPGACYFCLAATVETLQVACMIYFSGPVEPAIRKGLSRAWVFISKRNWPWTHHRLQRV